jgi:hypothetical protein
MVTKLNFYKQTDTDSFIMYVETEDFYEDMKLDAEGSGSITSSGRI